MKTLLKHFIVCVFCCAFAFWGLRLVSHKLTPVELIHKRVKSAFTDQALIANNYPWGSYYYTRDQYMDCSMLNQMFADEQSPGLLRKLILNKTYNDEQEQKQKEHLPKVGCEIYGSLDGHIDVPSLESLVLKESVPYDRYWWGVKDLLRISLSFLEIKDLKSILPFLSIFSILFWMLSLQFLINGSARFYKVMAFFIGLIPLAISGLPFFWTSWVHFPSWLLPFCFVALFNIFATKKSAKFEFHFLVFLGALTAYLEGLNGPLPLTLATLIVSAQLKGLALKIRAEVWSFPFFRILSFALGFGALIVIKILASSLFNSGAFVDFFRQLLYRTSTEGERFSHAWKALTAPGTIDSLAWGSVALSRLIVPMLLIFSACIGLFLFRRGLVKSLKKLLEQAPWSFALVAGFFMWVLLLRNHTAFHGFFMNRLFQLPFMGIALLFCAMRSDFSGPACSANTKMNDKFNG